MSNDVLTAIIECTNHCNYRCKYCFVNTNSHRQNMTYETLRIAIKKLLSSNKYGTVNFIWHGGEPLLRGLDFFRNISVLQEEFNSENKTYTNSIQTNGSLLDDETVNFLKENHFKIGLSLDGPKEINDATRVNSHYAGTYHKTINTIRLLQKHGLVTGAIATITRYNYGYPVELYELFNKNKIHMKLGRLVNSGRAKSRIEELRLSPEEYGDFATRLFDLWLNDEGNTISISPFESIILSMFNHGNKPIECIHAGRCYEKFLSISPSGDIYPCGFFQGYEKFRYGNIRELSLDDIERTKPFEILKSRYEMVERLCRGCIYFQYCHGGCPFSALSNNGYIFSKDYYCAAYARIFSHISEHLRPEHVYIRDPKRKARVMGGGGGGGGGQYTVMYSVAYGVWQNYEVVV